ncbi:xanthine dehydrogenase family protein molybdopterin-binding subunit [Microvirga pakistanensis]|uniref:xanthine dehydrogenase family protein molybdopterin-binding subunit n=1 Tax=Microvirga pakistanensis TaxID=1682650 RepID=UPI001FCEC622|nr:xanthine dehydrogenase family protein molybdopterin-binding subunit [Microvirga pakistanensis]
MVDSPRPQVMLQGAPPDDARPGIGASTSRIDGRAKVTGEARYGSDFSGGHNPAYAFLVTSAIARGRITMLDESDTRTVPGVLDILTYRNVGDRIKPGKTFDDKGYMGTTIAPLASDRVWHDGQIVAVVIADTFEAAREGAHRLKVTYAEEAPSATFDSPGLEIVSADSASREGEEPGEEKPQVGNAAQAFAAAPVKIDAFYDTPTQHHNPIELFTTTCSWSNGKLTVWESSQNVYGYQNGLAEQLGIEPSDVRIISPYIGGAFGARGSLTQRTALIAYASRRLNRPVKLEATRQQGFTIATYRAETRHRIRLGATPDGRLQALTHEGWEVSSRPDNYKVAGTDASTRLYACPNVSSEVFIVHADRNTPGFMRSPPEIPYLFALESAMDELAVALKMDPVELRRINDTQKEPIKGLPYTSRSLMQCFDAASQAFGWSRRTPEPGSMRDGDWLIGWGCATTMYPTQVAPAAARVTLTPQGSARIQSASHEIGTGIYTVVALTAADRLGIPLDKITVELGDSELPPAPVAGGSNSTASVCNVVAKACEEIRSRIARAAVTAQDSVHFGLDPASLTLTDETLQSADGRSEPLDKAFGRAAGGAMEVYAENIPHGAPPDGMKRLYRGTSSLAGGAKLKDRIQFAFGAQFVEVRVDARTREVRAPRMVGAYASGRIVNPKAAKSQLMGGQIWGISAALHEATEIDRRAARYYNDDLAEYLIPVNADIEEVQTIFVPEEDKLVNDLGIKGLGELGNVGLNAAVANAVFHATGVRIRELPIRIEKLLDAPAIRS